MINDKVDKLINRRPVNMSINRKKTKKVHFSKLLRVLLIPTSLEYFKAGIAHHIWSTPYDYIKYRRDSKLDDYKDKLSKTLDAVNIAQTIPSIPSIPN